MLDIKPISVLVADDEPDIRRLVGSWLERAGYSVTHAVNGKEAHAILQAKTFDLLISDMIMPEIDGVELIAQLKKTTPRTRVLAMSGGGRVMESGDYLRMAQALGADAAVRKPFTREQFLAAVEQALVPPPFRGFM